MKTSSFGKAYDEVKAWLKIGYVKYILIFILVLLLWSLLLPRYQRWQRKWLFCEIIKPGTSSTEVLEILDQYGEFSTTPYEPGKGNSLVSVSPINNWETEMRYGGGTLRLGFRDDVLVEVTESNHFGENIRNLCE